MTASAGFQNRRVDGGKRGKEEPDTAKMQATPANSFLLNATTGFSAFSAFRITGKDEQLCRLIRLAEG